EGATVLLGGRNFGCGSSREHAAWALQDYGFEAVVAPSFGDIFASNSAQIGLLTIRLPAEQIRELAAAGEVEIELEQQTIGPFGFEIDPFLKHRLLNGLDDIGLTLEQEPEIAAYEAAHTARVDTTALPTYPASRSTNARVRARMHGGPGESATETLMRPRIGLRRGKVSRPRACGRIR